MKKLNITRLEQMAKIHMQIPKAFNTPIKGDNPIDLKQEICVIDDIVGNTVMEFNTELYYGKLNRSVDGCILLSMQARWEKAWHTEFLIGLFDKRCPYKKNTNTDIFDLCQSNFIDPLQVINIIRTMFGDHTDRFTLTRPCLELPDDTKCN